MDALKVHCEWAPRDISVTSRGKHLLWAAHGQSLLNGPTLTVSYSLLSLFHHPAPQLLPPEPTHLAHPQMSAYTSHSTEHPPGLATGYWNSQDFFLLVGRRGALMAGALWVQSACLPCPSWDLKAWHTAWHRTSIREVRNGVFPVNKGCPSHQQLQPPWMLSWWALQELGKEKTSAIKQPSDCSHFLEQFLRAIWNIVSQGAMLIFPQIELETLTLANFFSMAGNIQLILCLLLPICTPTYMS